MSEQDASTEVRGLKQRLDQEGVICAEGYLFALERAGYLQAGAFVPEVLLEHPEVVEQLHRDFVRAGSDVVEAFTYYAHREKMRLIGREADLERMNRTALQVARKTGTLLAGNICNTNIYDPADPTTHRDIRAMFEEQIAWAVEEGADFLIAETLSWTGEAEIALDVMQATTLPTVVTLAIHGEHHTRDGHTPAEACKHLAGLGADVVGLNCIRGPQTLLPLLREVRMAVDRSVHVAALPVPFRTTETHPTFESLEDPACPCDLPDGRVFPTALDPFTCNRYELAAFGKQCFEMGVKYLGLCCGASPHHLRAMAEALGRTTVASKYSPDMSKHYAFGSDERLRKNNLAYASRL